MYTDVLKTRQLKLSLLNPLVIVGLNVPFQYNISHIWFLDRIKHGAAPGVGAFGSHE